MSLQRKLSSLASIGSMFARYLGHLLGFVRLDKAFVLIEGRPPYNRKFLCLTIIRVKAHNNNANAEYVRQLIMTNNDLALRTRIS